MHSLLYSSMDQLDSPQIQKDLPQFLCHSAMEEEMLQLFPNDPDLTFFQVSITGFPITNDVAVIKSILLFSADSFFAYDAIYVDFIPQKVRAEDALAEIPKAEET
uniref:Uncharacterized protein n=1 Tax=Solanum tuberosum TaxID=4113 RepID=M1CYH6_SOLTU